MNTKMHMRLYSLEVIVTCNLQSKRSGHSFILFLSSSHQLMRQQHSSVVDVNFHFRLTQERVTEYVAVPDLQRNDDKLEINDIATRATTSMWTN